MIQWEKTVEKTNLDTSISFNEIFVVTKETIRLSYFFDLSMRYDDHILISGNTGTGKSRIIMTEI